MIRLTRQEKVDYDGDDLAGLSSEDAGSIRRRDNNYDVVAQGDRRDETTKSGGLRFRTVDGRIEERKQVRVDWLRALQQAKQVTPGASNGSLDRRM